MILLHDLLGAVPDVVVLRGGPTTFTTAAVDSRGLAGGELFFAVPGPERDGHDFLAHAARSGARGLVVQRAEPASSLPPDARVTVLQVPDTLRALQRTAAQVRRRSAPALVAVTGSAGKTTTKTLIAAALGARYPTLSNRASFNNHLGVPLTLSGIGPEHTHVVCEIGTNHRGEVPHLGDLAAPDVSVVTNVGLAHLGNFTDRDELAREKTDLFRRTRPGGTWVVNGDDDLLTRTAEGLPEAVHARIVRVGFGAPNGIRALQVDVDAAGIRGVLLVGGRRHPFELAVVGRHFVYAAMMAVAVGEVFGIPAEEVLEALRPVPSPPGRARPIRVGEQLLVIDDSYNGSPDAMLAASALLGDLEAEVKVAVLGEMRELGRFSADLHAQVGTGLAAAATHLVTIGDDARPLRAAARAAGLPSEAIHVAASAPAAHAVVTGILGEHPGRAAIVLAKGSRFMHMERVPIALGSPGSTGPAGDGAGCTLASCPRYIRCDHCPDLTTSRPLA
jgi:UDP-N-acetylmuramoyl-tripeptide--D-alanyl-D-alanine ligase